MTPDGKPVFLAEWEQKASAGEELELEQLWDDPFILEWLAITPPFADTDLRGVLYVSREHAPLDHAGRPVVIRRGGTAYRHPHES